jgi:hypothetical protein
LRGSSSRWLCRWWKVRFGGRPDKPKAGPIIRRREDVPHNGVEEKSGNPFIYQIMQGGRPAGLALFLRTTGRRRRGVGLAHKVRASIPRFRCLTPAACRRRWIRPSTTGVP